LQFGGQLSVAAALQVDDQVINRYAIRTLRNITVNEGALGIGFSDVDVTVWQMLCEVCWDTILPRG
jgi:hypothetical protein